VAFSEKPLALFFKKIRFWGSFGKKILKKLLK